MDIYVCFDVEDLVHPEADDVPRDIGTLLADEGITASMYVVGEKARLWERRGRRDVIAAVGQHDVSYHTERHSMHPTVSEYLADKGWADGVAEAMHQEAPGLQDLARIFGTYPAAWATSGSSWGPQIPAATRQMGIPSNVYSHAHAGHTGACWFAGQLCYSDYVGIPGGEDAYCDDATFETALPKLLEQVQDAQRRGRSCLGLFAAHPTRLRHTIFWDALNFTQGQDTPPNAYKTAPRRDDTVYATALRNLKRAILAVRDLPDVHMVSNRDLNCRFAPPNHPLAWDDVRRLAQRVTDAPLDTDTPLASPAEMLDLLARAVLRLTNASHAPTHLPSRLVLGPTKLPPTLADPVQVQVSVLLTLCEKLSEYVAQTHHLPAALTVNNVAVGPGPLLKTLAIMFLKLDQGALPDQVTLEPGMEEPAGARGFAQDAIDQKLPGWPPHPPDLRLDQLTLHTRLQSWSLKPATVAALP